MKIFECTLLLRLHLLLSALLYGVTGISQEETLVYRVAHHDMFGYLVMWAMSIFAVLGFIDLLVNDVMPDRFVIKRALRDRHLVNMGLSLCFAVQMFTVVRYGFPPALLPYYALFAVFIPLSAFADVKKRYQKGCHEKRA